MVIRRALLLILLLVSIGGPGPQGALAQETTSALRELAERALQQQNSGQGSTVALLPGAMPEDLPFQFALPAGGRLIGSYVSASPAGQAVSIYVDVPADPGLSDLIEAQLSAQGWEQGGSPFGPPFGRVPVGGFQSSPRSDGGLGQQNGYCFGEYGTMLVWSASPAVDGLQAIRFSLTLKGPADSGLTVCNIQGVGPRQGIGRAHV